jgi:hypothetical protein
MADLDPRDLVDGSTPPLMSVWTRPQFVKLLAADRWWWTWYLSVAFPLFLVLPSAAEAIEHASFDGERGWKLRLGACVVMALVGMVILAWLHLAKHSLRCSACGRLLAMNGTLIVCGRCQTCGVRLFADDGTEDHPSEARPMTGLLMHADFQTMSQRRPTGWYVPGLIWGISGFVLIMAAGKNWERLYPILPAQISWNWLLLLRPIVLGSGLLTVGRIAYLLVRDSLRPHVPCPRCGGSLALLVAKTGNCSECGEPAIRDPFPGLQPRDPVLTTSDAGWTVAAFRALVNRRPGNHWRFGVFGLAIAAGMIIVVASFSIPAFDGIDRQLIPLLFMLSFMTIPMVLAISLTIGWNMWRSRDVRCPECRGELLLFHALVVSSRRCYHCGSVVLDIDELSRGRRIGRVRARSHQGFGEHDHCHQTPDIRDVPRVDLLNLRPKSERCPQSVPQRQSARHGDNPEDDQRPA